MEKKNSEICYYGHCAPLFAGNVARRSTYPTLEIDGAAFVLKPCEKLYCKHPEKNKAMFYCLP